MENIDYKKEYFNLLEKINSKNKPVNKEKTKQYIKKYVSTHRDKIIEIKKKYYNEHKYDIKRKNLITKLNNANS